MIHGHTHKPFKHTYEGSNKKTLVRWVLGDWNESWWVLSLRDGQFNHESYPIKDFFIDY